MSARRLALSLAGALLAGCGSALKSTLPPPGLPPSRVGVPAPALAPGAPADAETARLQGALAALIAQGKWPVPVQLARGADGALRVTLGADESFAPGGAQLRPGALALYAEIGDLLYGAPAFVGHVLVHGDAAEAGDPALDLTARRAASVQSYWVGRGLPETRVRAEGRGAREPLYARAENLGGNRRVEVVFKPVVVGREAEAWMPPPPVPPCDACEHP